MARDVRIEDLFRLILPNSPALSPDGSRVVFAIKKLNAKENRYEQHLWIVSAKGGRPRQLTHGLVSDGAPTWSPDGKEIAFTSDRGEKANLWVLPIEGGEPRQLTHLEGGAIKDLRWSPDGKELAFSFFSIPKIAPDEAKKKAAFKHVTRLYHKEDGFGWFRDEFWTLWKVNAKSGRTTALTKGPHHDSEPVWSPDSKRIAFISQRGKNADSTPDLASLYVMDRNGKSLKELTPKPGSRTSPRWSKNGRHLYWVGYEGKTGEWLYHEYAVWRTAVTSGEHKKVNAGHDRWPMNMVGSDTSLGGGTVMEIYESEGRERVLFGSDEDGSFRLYSISGDGGERPRLEVGGNLSVISVSIQGDQAVYCAASVRDTGEMFRVRLDGTNQPAQLTKVTAPFFTPLKFNFPEEFRFENDGQDLQGWVLKPPNFRAGKKYPCLIEVHGGPMTQYGESWFHEMHVLAAKGWVVAYCNPRGSSGRGMTFANCIEGAWGELDWSDMEAFADHLADLPFVDAKRMGMLGGSYGGWMVSWAVGHTDRYKVAITMRTAADFWTHFGSSDYGYFRQHFFDGKRPWDDPMAYHKVSPAFYAKNVKTPLLILHSEGDLRCPIAEGEMLFTSLKLLDNAPVEMIRFEGEFHGLPRTGKPRNREERLKRIVAWLEKYL